MVFQDPYRLAQPAHDRRAQIVAEPLIDARTRRRRGERPRSASPSCCSTVGLRAASWRPLSARILRRPAPAHRHRPRARARARAARAATSRSRRSTSRSRRRSSTCSPTCRRELGLAYLFIAHDLARGASTSADRVAVMYLGRIVEIASARRLFKNPPHPYTRALLDSVPVTHPSRRGRRALLQGEIPSASALPSGCRFRTRCPMATAICAERPPPLEEKASGHRVACHHVERQTSAPAYQ